MKTCSGIAAAMVIVLLPSCGSGTPPAKRQWASAGTNPETLAAGAPYRVAGVGLMMTSAQTAAALASAGYELDKSGKNDVLSFEPSFEDQVRIRASNQPLKAARSTPAHLVWRKGQETVRVQYLAYPGDSRVVSVVYDAGGPSPSPDEIKGEIEKRYGRGKPGAFGLEQWCHVSCDQDDVVLSASGRSVQLSGPAAITNQGAINRRLDAAARTAAGPKKGSF